VSTNHRDTIRAGSSGRLLPGTQARIVDPETGADLARGVTGEFWFRGPQAFKGYLNKPDATAGTLTSDGWVRTGDIGHFDADGYLYITDRLKELIKVKAFQVAPAELEALLLTNPAVADVAVIGRPDERAGEIPVAYVVGRGAVDREAIMSWVAERVVEYKQIRDVVPSEAIPKSPSGKILRRILRTLDAQR
jgi:4-coumarate--CoA ligase